MKETRNVKLPVIGRVQHGEQLFVNGKKQVKDYGYFIAKIQESNMQHYLDEFNETIKGAKTIDIQFLDDNPLNVRYARFNQGGATCYCMENETIGKQKVKNLWQPIECNGNCQYLKKDSNGKKACNRIAWLKFFIPTISQDRLWLMRITGQESIDNLKGYIAMQNLQGNSLKGIYTIFLKQVEQVDGQGKIHNNYILDIVKKSDIAQTTPLPVTQTTQQNTDQNENPVKQQPKENTVVNQDTKQKAPDSSKSKTTTKESKKTTTKKSTTKETTNTNSKKVEPAANTSENSSKDVPNTSQDKVTETTDDYALISISEEVVQTAKGEKKYVVGQFCNMDDKMFNIYIKPDFADELMKCDLGTMVKLTVQEKSGKKFAMDLTYLVKCLKKQVA